VLAFPHDKNGKPIGLLDEQYRGMDTKQVFDILKKEKDGASKGGQKDGESECLDDHGWNEAKEMSEEEKEKISGEIDQALREGAILAGRMNGNISREMQELLKPQVDWREALRNFVKNLMKGRDKSTWRRPNRRFLAQGIIMPSTYSDKIGRLLVGVDTSGSIGGDILAQFLGEVKSICDEVSPDAIDLLYWDSHVAKHEVYEGAQVKALASSTKPAGGGGTEPSCVPKYVKDKGLSKPQCAIMLTDGHFYSGDCGNWGEVGSPVMWCVIGNKSFVPTVGKAVHIN
jgi:predicted metal-dependent peptidase